MAKIYEICRICMIDNTTTTSPLQKHTKLYNIFEECDLLLFDEPISLIEEFYTNRFYISKNDQLPQVICSKCLQKFLKMKEFIGICEKSQKNLLKLFNVVWPKTEKHEEKYEEINVTNVLDHDIIDDEDFDNMTFDVIEVPKLDELKIVKIPIKDFQEENYNKISLEKKKTNLQEPKIIKIPLKKFDRNSGNIEKQKILKVRLQKLKDTDILKQTTLTPLSEIEEITEPKIIKLPILNKPIIDEPKIVKIPFSKFKENNELGDNRNFLESKIKKFDVPQIIKIPLSKFEENIVSNVDEGNRMISSSSDTTDECSEPSVEYFEMDDLFDTQISYEVIKSESRCTSSDTSDDDDSLLDQIEEDLNTFSCPHCIVDCTTMEDLDEHIKRRHALDTKKIQCEECGEILSKQQFTIHYKSRHKGALLFSCDSCEKDFKQEKNLQEHMKSKHSMPGNVFDDLSLLYGCQECGRNFQSKNLLERHKRLKDHFLCTTNKYTFSCDICTRTFANKVTMEKHKLERHKLDENISAKYKHKCDQCPRVFPRSDHLKLHIRRIHLGEANFKCELCDKTFVVKSEVKHHVARQHSKSHYKYKKIDDAICSSCNEKLPDYRTLRLHIMEKHSRTPQFKCSICGFEFFKKSKLDRHARLHNIEGLSTEEIIRWTKKFIDLPIDHVEKFFIGETDDIVVKTKDEGDDDEIINQSYKTNEVNESNEANEAIEALKDSEILFLDNLIEVDSEQIIG